MRFAWVEESRSCEKGNFHSLQVCATQSFSLRCVTSRIVTRRTRNLTRPRLYASQHRTPLIISVTAT